MLREQTGQDPLQLAAGFVDPEKQVTYSLKEYLESARDDASLYSSASERMVKAIGFDWFDQLEPAEGFEDLWVPPAE